MQSFSLIFTIVNSFIAYSHLQLETTEVQIIKQLAQVIRTSKFETLSAVYSNSKNPSFLLVTTRALPTVSYQQ